MLTVEISAALRKQMFTLLQQSYPSEGGGFLLGSPAGAGIHIRDIIPIENVADSQEQYHRYAMTPQDWIKLEDEADSRGLMLVGYYHSHPDSPAIPSEFDRVHALPNFVYLITQVQQAQAVDLQAWRLTEDRSQFDPLTLAISEES